MRLSRIFVAPLLMGCMLPAFAQVTRASTANEVREVRFAERVIMNEFVRALSPSMREARGKCLAACDETGALELAIGLIGVSGSSTGAEALVNLLGLRLDGAGSEEVSCQILVRGESLLYRLERMKVEHISEHCQADFMAVKKRELAQVSDVRVDQVCRSEAEIRKVRDDLIKALKSKAVCEQ